MPGAVENALHEAVEAPLGSQRSRGSSAISKSYILTIHDERFSKQSVLVSPQLYSTSSASPLTLKITPAQDHGTRSTAKGEQRHRSGHASSTHFVFTLEEIDKDVLTSYPSLEVSLLAPIASSLGLANRCKIYLTEVDREEHFASHVEIAFKDAYISRADMWRLLTSDLVGTTIYKNQKVLFLNSVKANVKAIYAKGKRVQSALLDASTKAIFRSDSSRYYILLQMSREMWDFDPDGGGEIVFNKVISGFLPELFRRWEALGTSHSVSVVMFTRMEYDNHPEGLRHQDYYRVLTTELISSESHRILQKLKQEFKTFLREVSISQPAQPSGAENSGIFKPSGPGVIQGRPAAAIQGNILEAIHTASLQFLHSNATCDLRRTGLSIIVITPGVGVFEVDRSLLNRTTDILIDNGIYIDLVCLSKMPLHSSPLFRYQSQGSTYTQSRRGQIDSLHYAADWEYAIPHWVDVSFWQNLPSSDIEIVTTLKQAGQGSKNHKFAPRVRMYEIQMTGLMQNELSVSVPQLFCPYSVRFPTSFGLNAKAFKPRMSLGANDLEGSKALYNEGFKELGSSNSPDKSSSQQHLQPFTNLLGWMDDYDDSAFKSPANAKLLEHARYLHGVRDDRQESKSEMNTKATPSSIEIQNSRSAMASVNPKRKSSSASTASSLRVPSAKMNPLPRKFGPIFKGFGAAKALATTHVTAEPVVSKAPDTSMSSRTPSVMEHNFPSSSTISRPSTRGSSVVAGSVAGTETKEQKLEKSKPIDITHKTKPNEFHVTVRDERELTKVDMEQVVLDEVHYSALDSGQVESKVKLSDQKSPWMTVLNPSNPNQLTFNMTSRLGRWQHVFPKPTQASTIKWKSLCSPASLPLTTEDFPSPLQLKTEYSRTEYEVKVPKEKEISEDEDFGEWLIRELVGSRLTRGFSVVVGTRPAKALDLPKAQWYEFLHEKGMSKAGVKIVMSKGTEIHELYNVKSGIVNVSRYIRTQGQDLHQRRDMYHPLIRTAYAHEYMPRSYSLLSLGPGIDWERLDNFVAADEEQLNKPFPQSIDFWRARFVLIPIALSGSRNRNHSSEDNEEEIRLEGIRKLTQMWQRNRFLSPNERKYESKTRKDMNPLDIVYQTRTASAVVSELNDSILADSSEQKPMQLLPEKELFERAKFSMMNLAKAIQGDKGIRLRDRRWHWRLHYHCFIGLELVTWLTNNLRDIDTREEAVEFGNQLMADGLFVHVERRHNFRDGNFFYQIAEKYRTPRLDVRSSWFGRLAPSVPPTPLSDKHGDSSKMLGGIVENGNSTGSTVIEDAEGNTVQVGAKKSAKASVVLSKQLVYDMDHRRKSNRRELVNLHVDRISSADDCYHVRIDWVTATPKLIEDTVETWATTAERSGLRLVEVPLLEASLFEGSHPFRHPYYIKLARDPPRQSPHASATNDMTTEAEQSESDDQSPSANDTSASPQQTNWPYHKAILKKFDFVPDLEAASDFPEDVAVTYSWGKPDYRSPQFITRSGRLLAQITPEGRLLLLINQLYKDRGSAGREALRTAAGAGTVPAALQNATSRSGGHEGTDGSQYTPRKVPITPGPISVSGMSKLSLSPFASPMLRATSVNDSVPQATANLPQAVDMQASLEAAQNATSASSHAGAQAYQQNSPSSQPPLSKSELLTVTELRIELEAFCSDPIALDRFYDEELHRPVATVPATPVVRPMSTIAGEGELVDESSIPPSFSLKEDIKTA